LTNENGSIFIKEKELKWKHFYKRERISNESVQICGANVLLSMYLREISRVKIKQFTNFSS